MSVLYEYVYCVRRAQLCVNELFKEGNEERGTVCIGLVRIPTGSACACTRVYV